MEDPKITEVYIEQNKNISFETLEELAGDIQKDFSIDVFVAKNVVKNVYEILIKSAYSDDTERIFQFCCGWMNLYKSQNNIKD